MKVLMFQPRFAQKVKAGEKRQTIRPFREYPIKVGDKLSLREWTGKPYRSKQRVLCEAVCTFTEDFLMLKVFEHIYIGSRLLRPHEQEALARNDGFADLKEMREWFEHTHGLQFHGRLIGWRALSEALPSSPAPDRLPDLPQRGAGKVVG